MMTERRVTGFAPSGVAAARDYFVTRDGRLVIRQDNELLVFENRADVAALAKTVSIPDLARTLALDDNLPLAVRNHVAALSLMNIPDDKAQTYLYSHGETDCLVDHCIVHRDGWRALPLGSRDGYPERIFKTAWVDRRERRRYHWRFRWIFPVPSSERYLEPVVHFYNGRTLAGTDVVPSRVGLPFRFRGICERLKFSQWLSAPDLYISNGVLWFPSCGPSKGDGAFLQVPCRGKRHEAWLDGFDGSVSMIVRDNATLVWYHVR